MARRLAFLYNGPRPLGWDIRFRVASLGVFGVVVLSASPWALIPLTSALAVLFRWARISVRDALRLVRSLALVFAFFIGIGVLLTPTLAQLTFLGVQSARLLLLFLASHFLMVTATPLTVTAAIQWFLGFLGARRAYKAASMASWALASVPMILNHASGIADAAALRGLELRRRPLIWMKLLTLGLVVKVVEQSASMAWALEARNFAASIPPHGLQARWSDVGVTSSWMLWCFSAMMLP